jgi:erythromycin esterase
VPSDTNFDDLQFLKNAIGERRLVQLGESGHGVAEFDSLKVRLIRFLHQQMGFDVIAFESGLYECHRADELVDSLGADSLMRNCIFGVWHADETVPLFEYIKASRGSSRPLTLTGFDTQFSTASRTARPADLRALLAVVDPALAEEAFALDSELVRLAGLSRDAARIEIAGKVAAMTAGYDEIAEVIDREQRRLELAFPSRPLLPGVMGQAMRMAPSLVRSLAGDAAQGVTIRDEGMADNISWLVERLYSDRKILVWAHNFHVQHDATELAPPSVNMGYHVARRHRDELYTIGLFMYWGQAAWNDRSIYDIAAPAPGSLEALLGRTAAPASFVDLLGQDFSADTAWMFQPIPSKSWGFTNEILTHRRQYDGILFVDEVHPPHYR